nr:hypothetical protein [Tessaracoccus rhinocerotis]
MKSKRLELRVDGVEGVDQAAGVVDLVDQPVLRGEKRHHRHDERECRLPHDLVQHVKKCDVAEDDVAAPVRRRPVLPQLLRPTGVPSFVEVLQRQGVAEPVVLRGVDHLAGAHERLEQRRVLLNEPDPRNARPRNSVQVDAILPEALAQELGKARGVSHEAFLRQPVEGDRAVGLARTRLIPADDREILLERFEQ